MKFEIIDPVKMYDSFILPKVLFKKPDTTIFHDFVPELQTTRI